MTNEEIQKLVSGYATNSLTDAERKALFEAALDDQELFNILQREQALKDVLDDPISRRQVREALEVRVSPAATPSWWVRWSTWGFATAALAAVLTVAVMFKTEHTAARQRTFIAKADRPAPAEAKPPSSGAAVELQAPEPKPMRRLDALKTAPTKRFERGSDPRLMKAAPEKQDAAAPSPPPTVQVEGQAQVQSQAVAQLALRDQEQIATSTARNAIREEQGRQRAAAALRQAPTAGFAGSGGALQAPLLTYTVVKRDDSGNFAPAGPGGLRNGDAVRINVVPLAPGYLTLYERDSTGNLVQLFPGIQVSPNRTYTVPDSPIDVKADQHLRLVLTPEPGDQRPPSSLEITLQ